MRKGFLVMIAVLLSGTSFVKAQSSLGIDTSAGSFSYVSSTSFNSILPFQVSLKNFGTQPYTGTVHIMYALDSTGLNSMFGLRNMVDDSITVTLSPGTTASDSTSATVNDSTNTGASYHFRSGINTVVIWPRMSSTTPPFTTVDSLKLNILVMGYNGIHEQPLILSQKIFPNPAKQELFIANIDEGFTIERVRIISSDGKLIVEEAFKYKLDLSGLIPGIYFIEFHNAKGKIMRYKLIKEI